MDLEDLPIISRDSVHLDTSPMAGHHDLPMPRLDLEQGMHLNTASMTGHREFSIPCWDSDSRTHIAAPMTEDRDLPMPLWDIESRTQLSMAGHQDGKAPTEITEQLIARYPTIRLNVETSFLRQGVQDLNWEGLLMPRLSDAQADNSTIDSSLMDR